MSETSDIDRLLARRARMPHAPVLCKDGEMLLVISGEHTVQFETNEDAAFFVDAYNTIPSLAAQLDDQASELGRLRAGALSAAERRIAELETERDRTRVENETLASTLHETRKALAAATTRARQGLVYRYAARRLQLTVLELQRELARARGEQER